MTTLVAAQREATRTLIDELLLEQRRLTPVERLARCHEADAIPAQAKYYRELLPAAAPGPGEQYAFAVDLDLCTGCKACVAACHSLNGLDEQETWRSVGLLQGCTSGEPFQQTVTTACHHCVEPACLEGCPVLAYEKDPVTGIVRHLDDQCIGCQYCILKCPYDVPKYSPARGIVRKCDMCANRLAVGEAPACAQACPNQAIRITVVNRAEAAREAATGRFLRGAPDPAYTVPTTRYLTRRVRPDAVVPADAGRLTVQPAHLPLVLMLVLTQLSVGAFFVETGLRLVFPRNLMTELTAFHSVVAFALGILALAASTAHLGRPWQAWRAVLGLSTSWLSREILVFGVFAIFATAHALAFWWPLSAAPTSPAAGAIVSGLGLVGVFCSVMIYHDTRRIFWRAPATALKFFGTTALLGIAAILFLTTLQALVAPSLAARGAYTHLTRTLATVLIGVTVCKLVFECLLFRHLLGSGPGAAIESPLRGSARLMLGELKETTTARFILGLLGGVVLPLVFVVQKPAPGWATLGLTLWLLFFALAGEILERRLFFCAVVAPKMPGTC